MKKTILIIMLVLILTVTLTGCGMKKENYDENIDTGFRTLETFDGYFVAYDKTTGVMYFINFHGGVTPIINADGTPRIWSGQQ